MDFNTPLKECTDVLGGRDLSGDGRLQVRQGDMTFRFAVYPLRASSAAY